MSSETETGTGCCGCLGADAGRGYVSFARILWIMVYFPASYAIHLTVPRESDIGLFHSPEMNCGFNTDSVYCRLSFRNISRNFHSSIVDENKEFRIV